MISQLFYGWKSSDVKKRFSVDDFLFNLESVKIYIRESLLFGNFGLELVIPMPNIQ